MRVLDIPQEELPGKLGGIPLFSGICKKYFSDFAEAGQIIVYEPGEEIVTEGDVSRAFRIVLSGTLDVVKRGPSGETVPISQLSKGAIIGEEALFFGYSFTATVRVKKETAIFVLPKDFILNYINENPKCGLVVLTCVILDLVKKQKIANEAFAEEKACFVSSEELERLHDILPFTMQDIMPSSEDSAGGIL